MNPIETASVRSLRKNAGPRRASVLRRAVFLAAIAAFLSSANVCGAQSIVADLSKFTKTHCASCHNSSDREGGLDLAALEYDPNDAANFATWVKAHDRLEAGEMPPKDIDRPPPADTDSILQGLAVSLAEVDRQKAAHEGRASQRRLNRYEFENALRDLLHAPWLQVKNDLPEDGEAELFNKVGEALDVSHVQMRRLMKAANVAMRHVMGIELLGQELPPPTTVRYWAREESTLTRTFHGGSGGRFNRQSPERSTFPVLGFEGQPDVRSRHAPLTVGESNPAVRELEAIGWNRGNYHPFHTIWNNFRAPVAGKYRVRFSGYTIWTGPQGVSAGDVGKSGERGRRPKGRWNSPDGDTISRGRRNESITVYAQGPIDVRRVGQFDITPDPATYDLGEITLLENESLVTDAARFFRDRPGSAGNPLAQRDGQPAVAFRWMEIEGPLFDESATAGYRTLFDDLPLRKVDQAEVAVQVLSKDKEGGPQGAGGYGRVRLTEDCPVQVLTDRPQHDAQRLLRNFMHRAYRRPVEESEVQRYLAIVNSERRAGHDFTYAMLAGYTAVICSPPFLFFEEAPGPLDDFALASRLSFFLWNSPPDEALLARAKSGDLRQAESLYAEVERMLNDPNSGRFIAAFLDYWLELRKFDSTTPSNTLYPDYYLDEGLVEAALDESRLFFTDLLQKNLPAKNVIDSDFTYLNERLAQHYGIAGVEGGKMRRVVLPEDSVRGGVMTQAIVLKVTANGTTTSPVVRGKWIAERILGRFVPPPPSGVPAVDPDTRGAVTIRQQLEKHRADPSCAACHQKIDPPGFALENFDVMGGWRDRYRGDAKDKVPEFGLGKNGWPFDFHYALPVESQGQLPDGQTFNDVREFKRLMLADQPQIARNLARHLVVYATGAPIRFGDRAAIEQIVEQSKPDQYGVRSLLHAIVKSDLFLHK